MGSFPLTAVVGLRGFSWMTERALLFRPLTEVLTSFSCSFSSCWRHKHHGDDVNVTADGGSGDASCRRSSRRVAVVARSQLYFFLMFSCIFLILKQGQCGSVSTYAALLGLRYFGHGVVQRGHVGDDGLLVGVGDIHVYGTKISEAEVAVYVAVVPRGSALPSGSRRRVTPRSFSATLKACSRFSRLGHRRGCWCLPVLLVLLVVLISDIQVNGQSEDMTAKEKLLLWSQKMTENYQGIRCDNFTTSWRDGKLFNAVIHKHQ
ncbi:hypothetical protein CRUP_027982 [Coryphaenoides rupestris]|nr:hypothetical protein CRUP_027982 [Coryphaenoides rupestris]